MLALTRVSIKWAVVGCSDGEGTAGDTVGNTVDPEDVGDFADPVAFAVGDAEAWVAEWRGDTEEFGGDAGCNEGGKAAGTGCSSMTTFVVGSATVTLEGEEDAIRLVRKGNWFS